MKIFNCCALLGLLQFCFITIGFSQEQNQKSITKISFSNDLPTKVNVKHCAEEVFRDCMQYTEERYLSTYTEQMKRISFVDSTEAEQTIIQNLSSIELKLKCNPDLRHDTKETFDKNTFNPLKYRFNFYASNVQYFQIDGTTFLIKLSPYKAD